MDADLAKKECCAVTSLLVNPPPPPAQGHENPVHMRGLAVSGPQSSCVLSVPGAHSNCSPLSSTEPRSSVTEVRRGLT